MGEGRHYDTYEKLGAHVVTQDGVAGVHFAVWAPVAQRVSVVGDFNRWDGRVDVMRPRGFFRNLGTIRSGTERRRGLQVRNHRTHTATCCH